MSQTDSKSGEVLFFVLALLLVAILVVAFLLKGIAGVGLVMVVLTPIMIALLVTISVGG